MPIKIPGRLGLLRVGLGLIVLVGFALQARAFTVVEGGKATAVIVTGDRPSAVVKYAAEELAYHVKKATGVALEVQRENAVTDSAANRIYLGDSKAVREAGIELSKLGPEGFVLRSNARGLFIVGDDGGGDPLDPSVRAGTLWGVYEWLDRVVKVRWLWPGELGTFVPQVQAVNSGNFDQKNEPRFFQRRIRAGLSNEVEHPALGFTAEGLKQYSRDQSVFLRRHRMGRSYPISYGHAFTDWWKKDGSQHPEWFQMRDDGKRGPAKPTSRFSMCVSNPDFQREIVNRWAAKGGASASTPFINACENDILGLCACSQCRAWDGPAPADYLKYYSATSKMAGSRFVSDRYAQFWLGVQKIAAEKNPNATVVGYVYFNYFQAPTTGVKLNPNVLLGYCPSGGFFPRSAEEHEWMKEQWKGWRNTGARLFLRTNHLLDGYCMPYIFAHQFGDEFQHAVRNGMVATDFDSLTGQWATQGPTLYLAARLHVTPDAKIDDVLAEYYSGFGPAAGAVKAYFDYWETYTTRSRENLTTSMEELGASRWRTWAKMAHAIYPPECFVTGDLYLEKAAQLSRNSKEVSERVAFLKQGLEHAKLSARVAGQLTLAKPVATKDETKALLEELAKFRRAAERSNIANFNHLAWVEDLSWKLSDETKKAPELFP